MHDRPRLLVIETSGRVGQVALAGGAEIRAERQLDEARRHARDLAPAVDAMLREQGWKPADLDGVIVSLGPGSYTGLRVGIMSARALCYATGAALLGIETFAVLADQAPAEGPRLHVLADAQQDRVYVQTFQRHSPGEALVAVAPLSIRPVADWLPECGPEDWITGPGVDAHASRLPADLKRVESERRRPRVAGLLQRGLARYEAGERDDIWSLEPIYLRPSAAEEQWQRRHGARK